MPFKFETKLIPQELDRRRKLTDAQKAEIEARFKAGGVSQRQLAKEYGVSRKLIQLIVDPEAKARNDQHIKEHWRDYYDRDKHTQYARDFRNNKKELDYRGQLVTDQSRPGFPGSTISPIPTKETDMIPNYLKNEPIRCTRSEKVREVANILCHLQHHRLDIVCIDIYKGKKCVCKTINTYDDLNFKCKKSKSKLVEIAASICGNRKQITCIKLFGEKGHKDYTVNF